MKNGISALPMKKLTTDEMGRMTAEEFRLSKKIPLAVVLDNVRSMHNVGAVFRTADAFRIESIVLCGCTATPPNTEIHKTALGAECTVSWQYYEHTQDALKNLIAAGYRVYAVEQTTDSIMLDRWQQHFCTLETEVRQKIALVMGHEVFGVQQEVVEMCHGCIEIPQFGTKHSLNVSVAAGIVMYIVSEQLRENK